LRASPAGASEAISYYHSDHLGSSNVITDKDGKQVGFTEFTPYGSTFKQTGTYDPKHKFTGKELDSSTGLYYYGARYYSPELGRFISADPTIQHPYDPQDLNRYTYCRNNPLNYVDPTGLGWFKKFWKQLTGAFVGGLIAGILTGGFGFSLMAAGFWGGMSGGALAGGLEGGWKGALIGGAMGGALGGLGGWGVENFGAKFAVGMLVVGAGVAGGTGGAEGLGVFAASALAGFAGGFVGFHGSQHFTNWKDGLGFISNNDAIAGMAKAGKYQEAIDYTVKRYHLPAADYEFDPTLKEAGILDPLTGKVKIGYTAFSATKGSGLQTTLFHESRHVLQNINAWKTTGNNDIFAKQRYAVEVDATRQTMRNPWRLNMTESDFTEERTYNITSRAKMVEEQWYIDQGWQPSY
jgi:RHS repeat-associated protein